MLAWFVRQNDSIRSHGPSVMVSAIVLTQRVYSGSIRSHLVCSDALLMPCGVHNHQTRVSSLTTMIALLTVPRLWSTYSSVSGGILAAMALFGAGWGISLFFLAWR